MCWLIRRQLTFAVILVIVAAISHVNTVLVTEAGAARGRGLGHLQGVRLVLQVGVLASMLVDGRPATDVLPSAAHFGLSASGLGQSGERGQYYEGSQPHTKPHGKC